MVFATEILVLPILDRFPGLLQDSLWRWMIRWPKHAWLFVARRRSVEDLVVIRCLRLVSAIMMQHGAAERRTT